MKNRIRTLLALALLYTTNSNAEVVSGCFTGQDQQGATVNALLQAERIGDYFEVYGKFTSPNIGVMKLKADGWSGAGRLFVNHEYESGAVFIKITNYSDAGFLLIVEGVGNFPFYSTAC